MITWDETKRRKNFSDHDIDFADLEAFFDGDLLTREDTRIAYGEQRLQSIGYLHGIALFVVWIPRLTTDGANDTAHLISARKAESHEYKAWKSRYSPAPPRGKKY
jgi:uncharacterized protein